MPECHLARAAGLHEDFTRWSEEILRVWQEFIRPDLPLDFFLVHPTPPAMETTVIGHVILVQLARPHACAALLSVIDSAVADSQVMRFATFVPTQLTHDRLVAAAHKEHLCGTWQLQNFCVVSHGNVQLLPHVVFPAQNGHEFTLVIQRPQDVWDAVVGATNLLQRKAARHKSATTTENRH